MYQAVIEIAAAPEQIFPGAQSRAIVEAHGSRFTTNQRVAVDVDFPWFLARHEYRLVRLGQRTRVEHAVTQKFKGLRWLLTPFLKGYAQRRFDASLKRLRDAVEAG